MMTVFQWLLAFTLVGFIFILNNERERLGKLINQYKRLIKEAKK
jgi:hypothetical protein